MSPIVPEMPPRHAGAKVRWSSSKGGLAPERIETQDAEVSIRSLALATRPPNTSPPHVRWSSSEGALAPERIETQDPRGLDTLAGARYSTTENSAASDERPHVRWSSREGAPAPERIETQGPRGLD